MFLPISYVGFGRCYCQVTVADVLATYNTEADVIALVLLFVD